MKTKIWMLLVSASVLGASAYAQAQSNAGLLSSGDVHAGFGIRDCKNSDTDRGAGNCGNHPAAELGGRWSFPIGDSFSVQVDAEYERYWNMHDQTHQVANVPTAGFHASYRDPKGFLVGGFAGYSTTKVTANSGTNRANGPMAGVEGQLYFDRVTLYGQAGKAWIDNFNSGDDAFRGGFGTIAGRFFPTDDSMIQVGWAHGKSKKDFEDKGDWGTAKDWNIMGSMRVTQSMPLYGYVKYKHSEYIANTEDKGKEKTFMVGVTWLFGAPSLYAQDRRGATLTTPMLPGRASGWAQALD